MKIRITVDDIELGSIVEGEALEVGGGLTLDVSTAMLLAKIQSRLGLGPSASA